MNIHDVYRPFLVFFRKRRIRWLMSTLHFGPATRVLDVGGNLFFWRYVEALLGPLMPQVTIVNLYAEAEPMPPYARWVVGDGCNLPFADGAFDVAFSNSVIEHLGTLSAQSAFSAEIRRVAHQYWIQTPDPRFFVEPHYITPFIHWLPVRVRRLLLRRCTVWGLMTRPSPEKVDEMLAEIRLLWASEFRCLFPGAEILQERFIGFPKSLVAVRR